MDLITSKEIKTAKFYGATARTHTRARAFFLYLQKFTAACVTSAGGTPGHTHH